MGGDGGRRESRAEGTGSSWIRWDGGLGFLCGWFADAATL